jgi:hypothetical protein
MRAEVVWRSCCRSHIRLQDSMILDGFTSELDNAQKTHQDAGLWDLKKSSFERTSFHRLGIALKR